MLSPLNGAVPSGPPIPFVPLHWSLYDRHELFGRFDPERPESFAETTDFAIYHHFIAQGGSVSESPFASMMQSLHDNSVTHAMRGLVRGQRVAAIMGGHKMARNSAPYAAVARLARQLTRAGILLCTGGGPGAMEAAHLGAALAPEPDSTLDDALTLLSAAPIVPALSGMVRADGSIDATLIAEAHAWFKPAYQIAASLKAPGESLAIPTWHYGHEPSTPFATQIAKYFQNSIREDGLLALATQGIIYAEGRAGTIQEIFQDAAQNYYRSFQCFSPMVLLGRAYWTERHPVLPVLKSLFAPEDFARYVLVTDSPEEAVAFVTDFKPVP
jgi:predicted Rossmann-fold nucleotide-binding protein